MSLRGSQLSLKSLLSDRRPSRSFNMILNLDYELANRDVILIRLLTIVPEKCQQRCLFTYFILFAFSYNSVVMSYNPAADSTIATPGKKRKRSEENGEAAPGHSVPVTPSTPATEEGLCPTLQIGKNLEHKWSIY